MDECYGDISECEGLRNFTKLRSLQAQYSTKNDVELAEQLLSVLFRKSRGSSTAFAGKEFGDVPEDITGW